MSGHLSGGVKSFLRRGVQKSSGLKFVLCKTGGGAKHETLATVCRQPQKYRHPRTTIRQAGWAKTPDTTIYERPHLWRSHQIVSQE